MDGKLLGKISAARFGRGGYQDAQIGLSLHFSMGGASVGTFYGFWGGKRSEGSQWTEDDRKAYLGETVLRLADLLEKARVRDVSQLVGIPVEVTLEGNAFKDFRVLEEVL